MGHCHAPDPVCPGAPWKVPSVPSVHSWSLQRLVALVCSSAVTLQSWTPGPCGAGGTGAPARLVMALPGGIPRDIRGVHSLSFSPGHTGLWNVTAEPKLGAMSSSHSVQSLFPKTMHS